MQQSSVLERLAERCGQTAAMNWLEYFLGATVFGSKIPYLVLMLESEVSARELKAEDVRAAVLLFEYGILGIPTGVYSTDDSAGFRTVISLPEDRAQATRMATEAILQRGAQIAVLSYESGSYVPAQPRFREAYRVLWAQRLRTTAKTLLLAETFESTLASLGKATRFNLGYYRRRLMDKTPCEFVADVRGLLQRQEIEELNRRSLNPDTAAQLIAQYKACWLPGGFLVGLRTIEGEWLSLIGGWRQGDRTVLHWQLNVSGYERLSIGTAMRSFFLQHEIEQGSRSLVFYGGTPHSIQNSFVMEEVNDFFVMRDTLRAKALKVASKLFASRRWFLPSPNFLARAICREDLVWHSADPELDGAVRVKSDAARDLSGRS